MTTSGIDSMFFSDVAVLAQQVDDALLAIKSHSEDHTAIERLAERLCRLDHDDTDGLVLRLLLTLADGENRSLAYWSELGQRLTVDRAHHAITELETLARSLESEQTHLEERLLNIG